MGADGHPDREIRGGGGGLKKRGPPPRAPPLDLLLAFAMQLPLPLKQCNSCRTHRLQPSCTVKGPVYMDREHSLAV